MDASMTTAPALKSILPQSILLHIAKDIRVGAKVCLRFISKLDDLPNFPPDRMKNITYTTIGNKSTLNIFFIFADKAVIAFSLSDSVGAYC